MTTTTRTMTNERAADLLTTLRYTTEISTDMERAIDTAIEALQPRIKPTLETLTKAVSDVTGVTYDELVTNFRHREYSEARFMVYWLAYRYVGCSMPTISRFFHRKTHVSVLHGLRRGDEWMSNPKLNPLWAERAKSIIKQIERYERES